MMTVYMGRRTRQQQFLLVKGSRAGKLGIGMSANRTGGVVSTGDIRRRAVLVGGSCGLLCVAFAALVPIIGVVLLSQSMAVLILLALCSALSGFLITARSAWGHVPVYLIKSMAGRAAVRASLITVFFGGAMLTLVAAFSQRELGFLSWLVISPEGVRVAIILSILPSIFTGIVAAKLAAAFKIEPTILGQSRSDSEDPTENAALDLSWNPLPVVLVVGLIGYVSPEFLPAKTKNAISLKDNSAAEVKAPPITAEVKQASVPSIEEPPVLFRYEKPEGLIDAPVSRWAIGSTWTIAGVDDEGPIVFSPDGHHLAFHYQERNYGQITVVDLYRRTTIGRVPAYGEVRQLAWDPGGERLFFVVGDACGLFHVEEGNEVRLPIPKGGDIPDGVAWWWSDSEILFARENSVFLDLESLEVKTVERSAKKQLVEGGEWQQWLEKSKDRLASNSKRSLSFATSTESYLSPNPLAGRHGWSVEPGDADLVVVDEQVMARHRLNRVTLERGNRYISSSDGEIILEVSDGRISCFYVALRKSPIGRVLEIEVGMARDVASESTEVQSAVADKAICMFVTSPVVNPLNGRTVAPDRERVKARARLISWQGERVRFWLEDVFQPIEKGDVIADPHFWDGNDVEPVDHPFGGEWFETLEELPFVDEEFELMRSELRGRPKRAALAAVASDPARAIERFVRRHHENASLRKLEAFVMDYAPSNVDYHSSGVVDRGFIRKDHLAYQAKWKDITEIVKNPIQVTRLSNDRYRARYAMDFRQNKPDGSWASGTSVITLILQLRGDGLTIVDQKAKVRNTRNSQAQR